MATRQLTGVRTALDQRYAVNAAEHHPVRTNGTITILVRGQQVTVDCPPWCTRPHSEVYRSLEDVSHHSDAISLTAPSHQGVEQVLTARISSWPFAGDPATERPFVAFDAVGDEVAQLTPEAALAAADQTIAHGYALRALVGIISGGAQ
ncbi:hypothetical protein EST92_11640 [Streptomyces sp. TM32]|uniref:DUF6907 domain-containing protein n=1 Tax=Streptomyces sp. TM32 TaxID=1652669 RepID=UPI0010129FFF|nr:hypothetical protein [Streptomyces sp. TM32]RXS84203.1 hypothetical protein EST92_11640 [Streptomyces sp. TM32]